MTRFRIWLLALVLALAAAGCAKGTAPGGGATQPAADTGALALRAPEGQQVDYQTTIRTTFNGRSLGGQVLPTGQPLAGKTELQYATHLKFEQVKDSQATIAYTLSDFDVKTEIGGKETPVGNPIGGDMRFTVKIDTATGKVLDADLGPGFGGILEKDQLMQMLNQSFAQFPAGVAARPGSSWTAEMPLDLPGIQADSKITVTTKYEANETRDGVQVAKLVSTGSGPLAISGEKEGVSFTLNGTLEMSGVQYIDLKTEIGRAHV